jgi:hypothetical protein
MSQHRERDGCRRAHPVEGESVREEWGHSKGTRVQNRRSRQPGVRLSKRREVR